MTAGSSEDNFLPVSSGGIQIRRFSPSDLSDFQAYRQDPDVGKYQGWTVMSDQEASGFIRAVSTETLFVPGEWNQLAIANLESGQLLGDIGINVSPDENSAELGITLSRQAQGQGIGFEATTLATRLIFDHTPVSQIVAICDARNKPAADLLKRFGFAYVKNEHSIENDEPLEEWYHTLQRPVSAG